MNYLKEFDRGETFAAIENATCNTLDHMVVFLNFIVSLHVKRLLNVTFGRQFKGYSRVQCGGR